MDNHELIIARAKFYNFLSSFYLNGRIEKDYEEIISILTFLESNPFVEDIDVLAQQLKVQLLTNKEGVKEEYEVLFNLPFGDFIHTSVSFYHEERELGEKTVKVKELMAQAGYVKDEQLSSLEDDYGFLFALSAQLLYDGKTLIQEKLFHEVIFPHVALFVQTQLESFRAEFYKDVAQCVALFCAFEKHYFTSIL